jgi:hypothetical protein
MRAVILGVLLGVAASAHAQQGPDYARAKVLYSQANTEMDTGKYVDAARDYGAAYDITHDPILFFKIANANEKAGRCDAAVVYFSRFLKEGHPKPEHAQLARERIIACKGIPPDARGAPAAPTPPAPAPTPPPEPAPAPPPAPAPAPAPPPAPAPAPHHASHTGAWLLVGGSLAFATAGAVLAYSANSSEQDLKDLYAGVNNVPPTYDAATASRYHDLVDQGHRYEYLSWASFGVAGACAIGAAIWFMQGDSSEHLAIAPVIAPHESGIAARVRF